MASAWARFGHRSPIEVGNHLSLPISVQRTFGVLAGLAGTLVFGLTLPFTFLILLVTGVVSRRMRGVPAPDATNLVGVNPAAHAHRPPASVIIPNWNGRDLLEKYLPSVLDACDFDLGDEVIVVDNASADGSAAWVTLNHPKVHLLALDENRGFGGGSNAGIHAAANPYVVLLNSDMRVEPGFLAPLLAPFVDPDVFAVAAQIRFSDPTKRREESGLTYAQWRHGEVTLGHDLNAGVPVLYPCFYPGGGSSAFDRGKLLELGGFDHLFRPFYLEDTDLGWEAWKRGWKVLYAADSLVYHEHRGTIGKRFSAAYVDTIVEKNRILFHWKHVLHPGMLGHYFLRLLYNCVANLVGDRKPRGIIGQAAGRALLQLPEVIRRRWRSAFSANISDVEALRRHRPDVFHDRFLHAYPGLGPQSPRLQVLFLSPYPIYPPHHGGAALMSQALRHLTKLCDVHLVVMIEDESDRQPHLNEAGRFASMHLLVRPPSESGNRFGLLPKAVREFDLPELHALLHRIIFENSIDVLQVEYTHLAQYAETYRRVVTALFEHDVYFQSVGRQVRNANLIANPLPGLEYLRALRFEVKALEKVDHIQVCTDTNRQYLESFLPGLASRIDPRLRAGIDVSSFPAGRDRRIPDTLLFVGNFRHLPNREGLHWLLNFVMPRILDAHSSTRLRIVGPNPLLLGLPEPLPHWVDLLGPVDDVQTHLRECAVFVCPVLTGSGVRVKLLEAFASGIPVVATPIGAEGLIFPEQPVCAIAESPEDFARSVLQLLANPERGSQMAEAAHRMVVADWDAEKNTRRLVARYHQLLNEKAARQLQPASRDLSPASKLFS